MIFHLFSTLIGTWLGFANPLIHLPPLVLLLPAGLAALGFSAPTPGAAFKRGWLTASLAFSACLYWIVIPVHTYGGLPLILALPCPVLLGFYLGLYPGLFALIMHWSAPRLGALTLGLLAGLAWFCLEYLRGYLFTGLPWLTLSQAFAPWPAAVQAAGFIGAYGLSGLFSALAVWLGLAGRHPRVLTAPVICAAVLVLLGWLRMSQPVPTTDTISAGIVQGNIEQGLKWDDAYQNATVDRYLGLTANMTANMTAGRPLDLVVWPETALPFYFQDMGEQSRRIHSFVRQQGMHLVTGAPAYAFNPGGVFALYNRAFLVGKYGTLQGHYDKEHLVPFGEYVPFGKYLPFASKLVAGVGDFAPGAQPDPLLADGMRLGVLICYEAIFPELAQDRVSRGANLLINISNDAWFGATSAPRQHLHLAVLRAVEQSRWIVRSTNTGISVFIDPRGRIVSRTGIFEPAVLHRNGIGLVEQRTFFSRHYALVNALLAGAALILLGLAASGTLKTRPEQAI